jgi:hypothetical protein
MREIQTPSAEPPWPAEFRNSSLKPDGKSLAVAVLGSWI